MSRVGWRLGQGRVKGLHLSAVCLQRGLIGSCSVRQGYIICYYHIEDVRKEYSIQCLQL